MAPCDQPQPADDLMSWLLVLSCCLQPIGAWLGTSSLVAVAALTVWPTPACWSLLGYCAGQAGQQLLAESNALMLWPAALISLTWLYTDVV